MKKHVYFAHLAESVETLKHRAVGEFADAELGLLLLVTLERGGSVGRRGK